MRSLRRLLCAVFFSALGIGLSGGIAYAQTGAQGQSDQLQSLIQELKSQLERGEKERLIDPWFLRDLRQVLGRYEYPWTKRLFQDEFAGRGPQPDPPWEVTAGEFLIDWRHGLRSVVRPKATSGSGSGSGTGSGDEAVKQLFGRMLEQAITGEERGSTGETAPADPGYAAAVARTPITNAFAIRLELTSRPVDSATRPRLEFGPYQGQNAESGYRLVYMPDASSSLELVSVSPRGTSTVEIHGQSLALQDGQVHTIEWTRTSTGAMVVTVDGTEVMNVTDRRFRDPFDGFAVVNSGGDYALRKLTIDGTG